MKKVSWPEAIMWIGIAWAVAFAFSCGEYEIRNHYELEQQLACEIVVPEVSDCPDYLATVEVVIVDQDKFSAMCADQAAFGCARFANNTIYILAEFDNALCQVITHEFMHFLGKHYFDNGDQDHDDFDFYLAYDKCKEASND